jgi:4-aminobutyrate aminotransferase-like enzyme/Ser/Thr protein kinase RdoA (MazF antagonist)
LPGGSNPAPFLLATRSKMDAPRPSQINFRCMIPEARSVKPLTETEAARLAAEIYGFQAWARALPGEYDDNFHLSSNEKQEFVLKIMHPARERSFLDLQCAALRHLAQRAPHLSLPRTRATRSGAAFVETRFGDGTKRFVWLLSYVPGTVLAEVRPHSRELLKSLGTFLGEVDAALSDFSHQAAHRELKWNLERAGWIRGHLHHLGDSSRRELVERFLTLYESEVVPALPRLRHGVIYGDANDHNVVVSDPWSQPRKVVGLVDFGDMHHGLTVSELAVAAAYAILGKDDPLPAAADVAAGYHRAFPVQADELSVLYALIGMRLAVSVTNSAQRKTVVADDPYVTISEGPAWEALESWARVHPRLAHYALREACGLAPVPQSETVRRWIASQAGRAAPVLDVDLRTAPSVVLDLSVGSTFLGADPKAAETANLSAAIFRKRKDAGVSVGVGRYDEARLLDSAPLFGASANPTDERRTIHLGLDLFVEPGTPIYAPLEGSVLIVADHRAPSECGPLVILRHETGGGVEFFTLYGHLMRQDVDGLRPGQPIARGQKIARVGSVDENGGWPPHVHVQMILDLLDFGSDFPPVARASERQVWTSLSPDPNLLLAIPAERFPPKTPDLDETLSERRELLGKNLSLSYERPLKIVRGWMQYLYDGSGRAFLDVFNNVPLVGHSHPRVVRAVQEQVALLNTNTRYLHDNVVRYADRLTRLLPEPLRVCFFVNSGSEANELALRLARAHTGREDVLVLEHGYHGHTNALIDISSYKFDGPGGKGRKPWVHVAPIADDYRGRYRRDDPQAGAKYARLVAEILEEKREEGRGIAAFIAESLPSIAGQIEFPPGYLAAAYESVRAAGGVCIADEVQVGFGRLGTHFWGFATQNVVPDIVVLGKPMGNAFPLSAVVTTEEIATSFSGMEFFSTFGGNPVACAAGLAVLDVLDEGHLQENALRVGRHLVAGLRALQEKQALVGDVRGRGLFLGVDFVRDRATREPAPRQASYIVNRLRDCGVLTGTDGPHHNVIKLRPPLIFSPADADLFRSTLGKILEEDAAQPF